MSTSNTPTRLKHPKPVIGLLGGPGAGKSTVARLFEELGCGVINADTLAHEAIQSEQVKQQLKAWWGDCVFDPAGRVDRKAVGQLVFRDEAERTRLEALLHPLVHQGRREQREYWFDLPDCLAVVEDCPLLLETGLEKQCDALVFIEVPDAVRLQRVLASRNWDADELKKRDESQISLDIKRQAADYVVRNDQDLAQVQEQVRGVLNKIVPTMPS